jgi:RimJ/RimL family protein N-acetyltransferase
LPRELLKLTLLCFDNVKPMSPKPNQTEVIRDLTPEDASAVAKLAQRAFPRTQSGFVKAGDCGKVAESNGQVVAACLVRILRLPSGGNVGFIAWLMTDSDFWGRGLAGKLVGACTRELKDGICDTVLTDVEGYNTASANVFYRAGYGRLSMRQQLRKWNPIDLLWIHLRTGLVLDPGHYLWVSDTESETPHPFRGWLCALAANTVLALAAFSTGRGVFRSGHFVIPSPMDVMGFSAALALLLLAHPAGMMAMARREGQPFVYRPWTGGWGLSFLIALGFGSTFPLPGNLYPPGDGWDVRRFRRLSGRGALISTLLLAGCILLGGGLRHLSLHPFTDVFAIALLRVGKPLLLFNTLIAVAPFEGFHGRHLRDWNKGIWLAMSIVAVALFFVI